MDFTADAITYVLLIIPTLFALVVVAQGVNKMNSQQSDGKWIALFGLALIAAIAGAYVFFIR